MRTPFRSQLVRALGGILALSSAACAPMRNFTPRHEIVRSRGTKVAAPQRVVVIGAGFAGLSAAHTLAEAGDDVVVLEASDRVGGRAATETVEIDGFTYTIQHGAQMISSQFATLQSFVREYGLGREFHEMSRYSAMVRGGGIERLDRKNLFALRSSGILGTWAWWRWGQSYFWNWRPRLRRRSLEERADWADLDRENGAWFERGWGPQVHDYADTVQRAFYFQGVDTSSRVLFLNLLAYDAHGATPGSLAGGFGSLASKLAAGLDVRLKTRADALEILPTGGVRITAGGTVLEADRVVIATTASVAKQLLPAPSPQERDLLDHVTYAPTINVVVVAARNWQSDPRLKGIYGFLIPASEHAPGDAIAALSFESGRFDKGVPPGHELLHIMLDEKSAARMMDEPDDVIETAVLREAERFLPGLQENKRYVRIFRHREAIARSPIGRSRDIGAYRSSVSSSTRIVLAGDYGGFDTTEGAAETGDWAAGVLLGLPR